MRSSRRSLLLASGASALTTLSRAAWPQIGGLIAADTEKMAKGIRVANITVK